MSALQWYQEVDFTPKKYPSLSEGASGSDVKRLQYLLSENGLTVNKNGIFDSKTIKAVEEFQSGQLIITDGAVCEKTWERLLRPANDEVVFVQQGDTGNDVMFIQERLSEAGYQLTPDGSFGPGTKRQLLAFQNNNSLPTNGVVDTLTFKALAMVPSDDRQLSQKDIVALAKLLEVPVSAVMAVNSVESRGSGFFNNNLAVILFERHIMRRRLVARNIDPTPHSKKYPTIVSSSTGAYLGGVREYDRLNIAKTINSDSAHESASWGLFQIMGFHWEHLGYATVDEYVSLMQESEGNQLNAFGRFVRKDNVLIKALRTQDWKAFARRYNGPGYAKNKYDVKMSQEYQRFLARGFG